MRRGYIECGADEAPLADKTANCPHTKRSESAVNFTSVSPKQQHPRHCSILPEVGKREFEGLAIYTLTRSSCENSCENRLCPISTKARRDLGSSLNKKLGVVVFKYFARPVRFEPCV